MKSSKPPVLATWLLEHFRPGPANVHIVGDLIEAYHSGRSGLWYWKEVLAAIVIGLCREITAHPILALRAISVGWTSWFLFYNGLVLVTPLIRRFVVFSGYPFAPLMLIGFALALFANAAAGWIVARLHRSFGVTAVSLFTASVFVFELRLAPDLWRDAANTLTNTRFLPYLIYGLELQFLLPMAILFGGLWEASSDRESRGQEQAPLS